MDKIDGIGKVKVHHYTIGRCGSAFISQILFSIFGFDNVWAGHEAIPKMTTPVVITYRDFRDVVVSYWRVSRDLKPAQLNEGLKMTTQEVRNFANNIAGAVRTMNMIYNRNPHALLMRYEDFFPDKFDFILNKIQNYFNIKLTSDKIKEIKYSFSLKENKRRSDKLVTFKKVGDKWMHGNHVYKGMIGGWKDLIRPKDYHIVENTLKSALVQWDYV